MWTLNVNIWIWYTKVCLLNLLNAKKWMREVTRRSGALWWRRSKIYEQNISVEENIKYVWPLYFIKMTLHCIKGKTGSQDFWLQPANHTTSRQRCCLFCVPACPGLAHRRSGSSAEDRRGQWGHQWPEQGGGAWSCHRSRTLSWSSSLEGKSEKHKVESQKLILSICSALFSLLLTFWHSYLV